MIMGQAQFGSAIRSVLCGPATTLAEILDRKSLFFWTFSRFDANGRRMEEPNQSVCADVLVENLREAKLPSETPEPHELTWEAGVYGLDQLIVLRPSRSPNGEAEQAFRHSCRLFCLRRRAGHSNPRRFRQGLRWHSGS